MINQADLPFHVSAGASNLGIVKTTEGSFHVYRTGAFHELITGWKFMIASERLASVLGALGDPHLTLTPATIVGVPEGVSISKYCELSISSELDPRNLANVDISLLASIYLSLQKLGST